MVIEYSEDFSKTDGAPTTRELVLNVEFDMNHIFFITLYIYIYIGLLLLKNVDKLWQIFMFLLEWGFRDFVLYDSEEYPSPVSKRREEYPSQITI